MACQPSDHLEHNPNKLNAHCAYGPCCTRALQVHYDVIGAAYADKFVAFVNAFKAALGPLLLTVDAIASNIDGTYCSNNNGFLDLQKLGASSIDKVVHDRPWQCLDSDARRPPKLQIFRCSLHPTVASCSA